MQHSLPTQLPSTLPVFPEVNTANQLMLPAKKLQAARVSYHRLAKRLENQFHIREYQRDQEKQEAVRQAKAQPNQVHRYS
jgi:hypothetical protein